LCRPDIVDMDERVCEVEESYNINLALHFSSRIRDTSIAEVLVRNDVMMGDNGRVMILTGPNQGGKTTYLQAIGLTHILAQAGLHVPGSRARISPVDNIFTHYPVEEQLERGTGRFGDEASRLHDIFQQATRYSLILLNESLSGTNTGEALYLAQDIVRILCQMGTRAVYATHMHELAAGISTLNEQTSGDSQAISMVASLIEEMAHQNGGAESPIKRSYKVVPSPPMGRSYAKELAEGYGISYEQITAMLQQRGVIL
jgi:DNA mismatch repair protein MutS